MFVPRLRPAELHQASALLTRFLEDFNGVLPAPWVLEPQTASFRRSASGPGFRVKPLS